MERESKISKAQQAAVHKYIKNNYDRIELTVKPKGKKDSIKKHAESVQETLNAFINRAIDEAMERDNHIVKPVDSGKSTAARNESIDRSQPIPLITH